MTQSPLQRVLTCAKAVRMERATNGSIAHLLEKMFEAMDQIPPALVTGEAVMVEKAALSKAVEWLKEYEYDCQKYGIAMNGSIMLKAIRENAAFLQACLDQGKGGTDE